MKRGLTGLLIAITMFAAPQVTTNQTVEAMIYGGVPLATIVSAIRTAARIQFSETKQDYDRLIAAGSSPAAATEIMKAIHHREYLGIDNLPAQTAATPVPVAIPAPRPDMPTAVVQPVETPAPVVMPSPPAAVPAPGIERNWNVAAPTKSAALPVYAKVEQPDAAKTSESAAATAPRAIVVPGVALGTPRLGADRRLYISPMEGKLDGFIAAEVIKEHLPVQIVLDDNDVDLVLVGQSVKEDDHWYNAVWGGKDKNEGNLRLIDVRSRSMVWAGEAGDRSLIYGKLKRGGERKVAERLVRQMKKDYFRSTE